MQFKFRFLRAFGLASTVLVSSAASAWAGPSILIDLQTGRVLEEDNAFQRWYPASLSKLMTTYVAFRAMLSGEVTPDSPIVISKEAAKEPPSKMAYKPGSVLTLDNALKIIMVKSANDVAHAIAESIGGSVEGFAARMNAESQRLGMTGSHWVNPHGLHSDEQYTTARDLAILSKALRDEFPEQANYFGLEGIQAGKAKIKNHNDLIRRFDGADGMKTGYTCPAGFNIVASATREGRTLLAVVVGATSVKARAEQSARLLARGFTFSGANAPYLATMQPQAFVPLEAVNMRDTVCPKKRPPAELAKQGTEEVDVDVTTPFLHEPDHPPRYVAVTLGGATGPAPIGSAAMLAGKDVSDVPVPTPRPAYTPETKAVASGEAPSGSVN